METRMQKYYDETGSNINLREKKNTKLYENLSDYEVDDIKINSNETVIDNNAKNIDIESIKKILDTKYNKEPKRRSIVLEEETKEVPQISLEETREYDINAILQKAKEEKDDDYESERHKKLRDTQFNILNSLDIDNEETAKDEEIDNSNEVKDSQKDELVELINTITMRELDSKNPDNQTPLDPLDILTDLKGEDNTVIVGAQKENESINETAPIMSLEDVEKIKPQIEEQKRNEEEQKKLDLTNTLQFTQSDFDDFNDLKKEVRSSRALIYAIIILVCLIALVGLVIFLNSFLNMNLF